MSYNFFLRTFVILLAIATAYVIYRGIIDPHILNPLCLTDSNNCVQLSYYKYNNSILVNMQPTGFWVWYNGNKAFLYGQNTGNVCNDPNFETAYVIDKSGVTNGYECINKLDLVKNYYSSRGEQQFVYIRTETNVNNFNVYDVLNYFNDKNIIKIN